MSEGRLTVAILTHWSDDFEERRYLIKLMFPKWKEMGFETIVARDGGPFIPASLAFVHCDLSVMPESIRRLAERYPRAINGDARDIRKRRVSSLPLKPGDNYSGKVIVKTDWNGGGGQEFRERVLKSLGWLLRTPGCRRIVVRFLKRVEARRSWSKRRVLGFSHYSIFDGVGQVPAGVWENPNLMVEPFRAERDGRFYCCRHWLFLGTKEVTRRTLSLEPIVKVRGHIEPTNEQVPEELRAIRRRLGIDFGKFDYALVDGEAVLYDVNHTPGAHADASHHAETISALAPALTDFMSSAVGGKGTFIQQHAEAGGDHTNRQPEC